MDFYRKDKLKAVDAKFEAQKIAFAPFVFQAAKALRDLGILKVVESHGEHGISLADLTNELKNVPPYGLKVLTEAGLGIGLLLLKDGRFSLTNTGYFIQHDPMTQVNMNFVHDVNYAGFFHFQEAIKTGKPAGLKTFGKWPTIYEALASLPPDAQKSWFEFDHFYSDAAFDDALKQVFKNKPKKLLDIGGNTGKWALQCLKHDPEIQITIADLPGQLRMAEKNISEAGFEKRVSYHAVNLLDPKAKLPQGHDAIWMSQFLDCFSQEQIVTILKLAAVSMKSNDKVYILETYWDRQKFEAAAFCLQQTSLYFTCLANGNSQMYHSNDMKACLNSAGFKLIDDVDNLGISHTLFTCIKA